MKALTQCKYSKWALDKVEKRLNKPSREVSDKANNQGTACAQPATNEVKIKGHIVIPYTQGLCESIKRICGSNGIQTPFKGSNTIRNLLVSPKDKDPMVSRSGAIYWFQCGDLSCDDEYMGGTSRTFGERYKEHLKLNFSKQNFDLTQTSFHQLPLTSSGLRTTQGAVTYIVDMGYAAHSLGVIDPDVNRLFN